MRRLEIDEYTEDVNNIIIEKIEWNNLKDKCVLVTGATGMVGKVLVDVLMSLNINKKLNIKICVMSRNKEKIEEDFSEYLENEKFVVIQKNIKDSFGTFDYDLDYIIHTASNTHPDDYANKPIDTIMLNVLGTNNMLELAVKTNAKMLFLSTVEVYGKALKATDRFDEKYNGEIDCNTLRAGYPESKRVCESLCQSFIKEKGVEVKIARLPRLIGPTFSKNDSKVTSQFINNGIAQNDILIKSSGEQKLSFLYVPEAVKALFYILFYGKNGEAYNISDSKCDARIKQIAKIIAKNEKVKIRFEIPEESEKMGFSNTKNAIMDSSKLKNLGWKNNMDIQETINKTIIIKKKMLEKNQ